MCIQIFELFDDAEDEQPHFRRLNVGADNTVYAFAKHEWHSSPCTHNHSNMNVHHSHMHCQDRPTRNAESTYEQQQQHQIIRNEEGDEEGQSALSDADYALAVDMQLPPRLMLDFFFCIFSTI